MKWVVVIEQEIGLLKVGSMGEKGNYGIFLERIIKIAN